MDESSETWRPVVGYEGLYEVSDRGSVRSLDRFDSNGARRRARPMAIVHTRTGHLRVGLSAGGTKTAHLVHRLVLEAFVGPCSDGMECCHNDGDPTNNRVENLRWDTRSENMRDAVRHGTNGNTRKKHCPAGHPLTVDNLVPSSTRAGGRGCLACHRNRAAAANRAISQAHKALGLTYHEYIDTYGSSKYVALKIIEPLD